MRADRYELFADDVRVFASALAINQAQVDFAARAASRRGWNGTVLDLHVDGEFVDYACPSDKALAEETH